MLRATRSMPAYRGTSPSRTGSSRGSAAADSTASGSRNSSASTISTGRSAGSPISKGIAESRWIRSRRHISSPARSVVMMRSSGRCSPRRSRQPSRSGSRGWPPIVVVPSVSTRSAQVDRRCRLASVSGVGSATITTARGRCTRSGYPCDAAAGGSPRRRRRGPYPREATARVALSLTVAMARRAAAHPVEAMTGGAPITWRGILCTPFGRLRARASSTREIVHPSDLFATPHGCTISRGSTRSRFVRAKGVYKSPRRLPWETGNGSRRWQTTVLSARCLVAPPGAGRPPAPTPTLVRRRRGVAAERREPPPNPPLVTSPQARRSSSQRRR